MFGIVLGWLMKMTRGQKTQCVLIALKSPSKSNNGQGPVTSVQRTAEHDRNKSESGDELARCIGPAQVSNCLNLKYGFSNQEFVQAKVVKQGESLIVVLKILADLDFANGYKIRESTADALACYRPYAMVLDVSNVNNMDTTGVHVLESVTTSANDSNTILALGGVKEDGIGAMVKKCCTARVSKVSKGEHSKSPHLATSISPPPSHQLLFTFYTFFSFSVCLFLCRLGLGDGARRF
jgi:anti-anti-sigma regulatory factor